MSAIDRELLVMRGFAASRGDDDAIDEAQRDVELMRVQIAALEAKVGALRAALVGLAKEVEKRVADPAPELRYAMAKARSATEATK